MNFINSLEKIRCCRLNCWIVLSNALSWDKKFFYDLSPALLFSLFYVLRELEFFFHRQSALSTG